MKILSFNVNSLRAICKKFDLENELKKYDPDIIMFQETKFSSEDDNPFNYENYHKSIFVSTSKKGYSGTMTLSRNKPINVSYGIDGTFDDEGRVIISEFENFYTVNSYSPNSKDDLSRIPYRMKYDEALSKKIGELGKNKPVILGGDLNCAPEEIDLKNPKTNTQSAGFTIEERNSFKQMLINGNMFDSFRYLYPEKIMYSWWSYRMRAREKNVGWRIDHFLVSNTIKDKIKNVEYLNEVFGSDHCPVLITVDL